MKKSTLYTRAGDKGETSLFGGKKVKKTDPRVSLYGTIDELNASLGIALAFSQDKKTLEILLNIQNELLNLGAEVANPRKGRFAVRENQITNLEKLIDLYDSNLPRLTNFILPSGTQTAAFLHQARTICRRTERQAVALSEEEKLNPNILKYLNRLSDLLFVLARTANGGQDILWKK